MIDSRVSITEKSPCYRGNGSSIAQYKHSPGSLCELASVHSFFLLIYFRVDREPSVGITDFRYAPVLLQHSGTDIIVWVPPLEPRSSAGYRQTVPEVLRSWWPLRTSGGCAPHQPQYAGSCEPRQSPEWSNATSCAWVQWHDRTPPP